MGWREVLGVASPILGGFHFCHGYNRYPTYNRKLMKKKARDNYYNKIFVMLTIAVRNGYEYVVSLDDDVMLPPSTLAALLGSGPWADDAGCGAVLPLTQNGIPSVEMF